MMHNLTTSPALTPAPYMISPPMCMTHDPPNLTEEPLYICTPIEHVPQLSK